MQLSLNEQTNSVRQTHFGLGGPRRSWGQRRWYFVVVGWLIASQRLILVWLYHHIQLVGCFVIRWLAIITVAPINGQVIIGRGGGALLVVVRLQLLYLLSNINNNTTTD